jgi:hypothetical protein
MAKGDFQPYQNAAASKMDGSLKYVVAAGTTASINAGEPVTKLAGANNVVAGATNIPTTTLRIVGIAVSASNETASVSGLVDVVPTSPGQLWMVAPKVAATWNTQAKYNALVGARVLIDLTAGVFTLLAADGASNGCVVEFLDIARYPGMVAFSWSPVCDYRNV